MGVAGGLHPAVKSGDLIIAEKIFEADCQNVQRVWPTHRRYCRMLRCLLAKKKISVFTGAIAVTVKPVLAVVEKRKLNQLTGALAVDMESSALAHWHMETGRPFFILRAGCDTADREVSPDLFHCANPDGRMRPWYIFYKMLEKPQFVMELMNMQKSFATALNALKRSGRALTCNHRPHLDLC